MKIEKGAKKANRLCAILLIAVLLVAQFITAAFATPFFSYAQNYEEEGSRIEKAQDAESSAETEDPADEEEEEQEEATTESEPEESIEKETYTDAESEKEADEAETEPDEEIPEEKKGEEETADTQEADTKAEATEEETTKYNAEETSQEAVPEKETPIDPPKRLMLKGTRGVSSYADALTNRSNDIGVSSEGYADSPYTFEKTYSISANLWIPDANLDDGGTVYVNNNRKVWQAEQYWDGKAPFRVTSASGGRASFDFQSYNDFLLEDDAGVVPYGAFKLDNIDLLYCRVNLTNKMNLYGRGNKFVIGENVSTESGKLWKLYGGTEHNRDLSGDGRPDVITNVVVASGNWDYVFGGGEGATGTGTQVTIRGDANVQNVYGGGERKGSVGIDEPTVNGAQGNPNNPGINVYVEGGNVDTLYGGSAINGRGWIASEPHALHINEDIRINVSGGYVNRIFGGSDTHDDNGDDSGTQPVDYSVMGDCNIFGDVTVNLSSPNVAGTAVGDINRNLPRAATNVRQVQGETTLNVTADQQLEYAELFDKINIDGANVKLLNEAGFTTFDSDYSSTEGYIGQISVTNGGRLELTKRAIINEAYAHYDNTGRWNNNWTEPDRSLKATGNHTAKMLRHGWTGESSEADRADSVIAINGQMAGITAASGTAFNDSSDVCGLLIHGSVGGDSGWDMQGSAGAPGYSTLEVLGNPIYSTGDDYYYYIVADGSASNTTGTISKVPTSVNGGAAFKEPEGADYIVCYRYLEGGKIGWYLREKPTVSATNVLAHAGDDSAAAQVIAHIELNGFAYEWSDTEEDNSITIVATKYNGTESVTWTEDISISTDEIADIENDERFTNVVIENGALKSFDVILDGSAANEASYYELYAAFVHDDERAGVENDCIRATYDFVNTNEPGSADYQDSTMTTYPYDEEPIGDDMAKLIVSMPYGCEAESFSISENDGTFSMVEEGSEESITASLHSIDTVNQNYNAVTTQTANSAFAVEIGRDDLVDGVSKSDLSGTNEYICKVMSYKNVNKYEISPEDANGLRLTLLLSGISKEGEVVGVGNPSTVNNGELRIQAAPLDSEIIPPVTGLRAAGIHGSLELLEKIWLLMAISLIFLTSYIKLKKHWRWSNA